MYHFSLRTLYVLDKRPCDAKMLHCTAFFFIQTEFAYYFPSCAMHWCVHSDVPFLQISCHLKRSRGKVFFLYYWLIICNFSRRLIKRPIKIIIHCNYNNTEINAFNLKSTCLSSCIQLHGQFCLIVHYYHFYVGFSVCKTHIGLLYN